MKKTATTVAAFIIGAVLGFLVAPQIFQWLASAFGGPLIVTSPGESITSRGQFGFGFGVVFAAASIVGRSLRWCALYLFVGLAVSAGVAALYRGLYASSAAEMGLTTFNPVVSFQALPILRIPLVGAVAILCLALVFHFIAPGSQAASTPNDRDA